MCVCVCARVPLLCGHVVGRANGCGWVGGLVLERTCDIPGLMYQRSVSLSLSVSVCPPVSLSVSVYNSLSLALFRWRYSAAALNEVGR